MFLVIEEGAFLPFTITLDFTSIFLALYPFVAGWSVLFILAILLKETIYIDPGINDSVMYEYSALVNKYQKENAFGVWDGVLYSYDESSETYAAILAFDGIKWYDEMKGHGKSMNEALENLWDKQMDHNAKSRHSYEKMMGKSGNFKDVDKCKKYKEPYPLKISVESA